jgi:hypothetical protein
MQLHVSLECVADMDCKVRQGRSFQRYDDNDI